SQPLSRIFGLRNPRGGHSLHDRVAALRFSPDDRWLACSRVNMDSYPLLDLRELDGEQVHLEDRKDSSYATSELLAFTATGEKFATAGWGGHRVWQLPAPLCTTSTKNHQERPGALAFNARGERVAVVQEAVAEVKVVALTTGRTLWSRSEQTTVSDM